MINLKEIEVENHPQRILFQYKYCNIKQNYGSVNGVIKIKLSHSQCLLDIVYYHKGAKWSNVSFFC